MPFPLFLESRHHWTWFWVRFWRSSWDKDLSLSSFFGRWPGNTGGRPGKWDGERRKPVQVHWWAGDQVQLGSIPLGPSEQQHGTFLSVALLDDWAGVFIQEFLSIIGRELLTGELIPQHLHPFLVRVKKSQACAIGRHWCRKSECWRELSEPPTTVATVYHTDGSSQGFLVLASGICWLWAPIMIIHILSPQHTPGTMLFIYNTHFILMSITCG